MDCIQDVQMNDIGVTLKLNQSRIVGFPYTCNVCHTLIKVIDKPNFGLQTKYFSDSFIIVIILFTLHTAYVKPVTLASL